MSATSTPAQFPGTDPPVPNQDDALLQNGSVIDPNTRTTAVETLTRPNNKGNQQPVTPVRAKRRSSEMTIVTSWLPPGWVVEDRIRTSGVTAGTVDKVAAVRSQLISIFFIKLDFLFSAEINASMLHACLILDIKKK